jgi:hypothetical protein
MVVFFALSCVCRKESVKREKKREIRIN